MLCCFIYFILYFYYPFAPYATDAVHVQLMLQGPRVVDTVLASTPETPLYMTRIQEAKIVKVPLMDAVSMMHHRILRCAHAHPFFLVQTRAVAQAISEKDFDKAMLLRDLPLLSLIHAAALPTSLVYRDHAVSIFFILILLFGV